MMTRKYVSTIILAFVTILLWNPMQPSAENRSPSQPPAIQKLGTIDSDIVEITPVVFHEKLYRFEYIRSNYYNNQTGNSYFRFVDHASGETTPAFAAGYHLGCAFAFDDTMYVYGVEEWGGNRIQVFWSKDLQQWNTGLALDLPGWRIFNTSVCKGKDAFTMAFEIDAPPEETGSGFTIRFASSSDLLHWALTPSDCVYTKKHYSACPYLHYLDDGYYYMIYLHPYAGPAYKPHIVRSKDLVEWESSSLNPVLMYSDDDKKIANPRLSPEQQKKIAEAVDINNSDVDLCEYRGKVVINYSWGNQQGTEFLAEAEYAGSLDSFFHAYFPEKKD